MTTKEMPTEAVARYVDAVADTARNVEALARRVGFYSKDCDCLDAAIKRGASGVVILFDKDGTPEIHTIGPGDAEASIEKDKDDPSHWTLNYRPLDENELTRRVAAGKAQGTPKEKIEPMNLAKPHKAQPTGDEERKAQMAADAKRDYQNGVARNVSIAERMKAEAAKLWAKKY
jgi:hypothetical protein